MDELDKRIKLEALITQREAMLADNLQRERQGYAAAWDGPVFFELSEAMEALIKEEPSHEEGGG